MLNRHGDLVNEGRLAVGRGGSRETGGRSPLRRRRPTAPAGHRPFAKRRLVHRTVRTRCPAGDDARQQRPHGPVVGEHPVLALGEKLRLPDHVENRMYWPLGRRMRGSARSGRTESARPPARRRTMPATYRERRGRGPGPATHLESPRFPTQPVTPTARVPRSAGRCLSAASTTRKKPSSVARRKRRLAKAGKCSRGSRTSPHKPRNAISEANSTESSKTMGILAGKLQ